MGWLELKIPPPAALFVTALIMWAVNRFIGGGLAFGIALYVGIALMVVGFGLAFRGLRTLVANRTTPSPIQIDRAKKLVTEGLYSYTRNPMYLGMVIFLIGVAALFGSVWQLIGPAAFSFYITRFQIAPEERMMASKFGADYKAYQQRVRRWI